MKIYIAHSKALNYVDKLYKPIRENEELKKYEILLPHEKTSASNNPRDFYKDLSVMIAEVSYPATGMGIELGWAYDDGIPIYSLYQKGCKVSGSLKVICNHFIEYSSEEELVDIIKNIIVEIEEKK